MDARLVFVFLMACDSGKAVSSYVSDLEPDLGGLDQGQTPSDTALDETDSGPEPSEEPATEPSAEPAAEPSQEPASEPSEERVPASVFSEFVEDALGLERGSSGLNGADGQVQLWLDASFAESLTLEADNQVSSWANRGAGPSGAVQVNSDNQPTYQASTGMLTFNGNQFFLVDGQLVDLDTSYFVVYESFQPSGTLFAKAAEFGNWSRGGKTFFIRNGRYSTDVGWVGYLESNEPVPTDSSSIALFEHVENGNTDSHRIFQNGLERASRTWNYNNHSESDLNGGVFKIGITSDDFPQSHGLYGKIGEIIKIDASLSAFHRSMVFAYLAQKWGLVEEVDSDGDGTMDAMDPNPIDPNE